MFEKGFGLDHGAVTALPPNYRSAPKHIQDLMKNTPQAGSNRFVSLAPSSSRLFRHKMLLSFSLPSSHGSLQKMELVVYTRPAADATLVVSVGGNQHLYNISSSSSSPITIPLDVTSQDDIMTSSALDVEISVEKTLLSSRGMEVTSTLPINKAIQLREKASLLLHFENQAIRDPLAGAARRDFLHLFGESPVGRERRATSFCQKRDLIVNFSKIGLNSVVAPVDFNAHACSGQCHLDHSDTPMTNHAYIKNMLHYGGSPETAGAVCVSDVTTALTLLVREGQGYHVTVYEDMIVESCSCR